jgi:hypothetical protein
MLKLLLKTVFYFETFNQLFRSKDKGGEGMKKIIVLFIVAFISLVIADLVQGLLLTSLYTPNPYSTSSIEMTKISQYIISSTVITIAFWSILKLNSIYKSKSQEKAS